MTVAHARRLPVADQSTKVVSRFSGTGEANPQNKAAAGTNLDVSHKSGTLQLPFVRATGRERAAVMI